MLYKTLIIIFFATIFFSGCVKEIDTPSTFNLKELGLDISRNLTDSLKIEIKKNEPLLVTDFVNTKTLINNSELGFLLSNAVKDGISQRTNFLIKEIEITDKITFGESGLNALARDLNTKEKLYDGRFVLVGTYTLGENFLIIFTKIIDFTNNNIIASSTQNIRFNNELLKMDKKQRIVHTPLVL